MDFNKITRKQLILTALIVPILLAVIWAIRCQIISSKEYTIQRPIEKCNIGKYDDDGELLYFHFNSKNFSKEGHKMSNYIAYEKDSDGFYYPDNRITPPLNKPYNNSYWGYWNNRFYVGHGQSLWMSYYINKAIRNGQSVYGTIHIKNGKDKFLGFVIDGDTCLNNEACSDKMVESALNNYAEVLDSVENNNSKAISNYCNTAICDPENSLIYAYVLKEKFEKHLPPCLQYLLNKKKDDSEFRETLIAKAKGWYEKYKQKDKYGNLQSAIQQLKSTYHWVNQENYKELYKIYNKENEDTIVKDDEANTEEDYDIEVAEVVDSVVNLDEATLERRRYLEDKYAQAEEKICELVNFKGKPDHVTITLIGFWTRRWNDGSAETIYNVLKDLNLE
ncbi:MAG: hypothetical protein IKN77_04540 [Paludibacteraceae bacterium]|nr:hypothetical protein [Paludibacteraceae bacterium]